MRLIALFMVIALPILAGPRQAVITVNTDTNGVGTAVQPRFTGRIDTIGVSVADGTSTGTVSVVYSPRFMSDVNLATNAVTGSKTFRPRVDTTDVAGEVVTNPVSYVLVESDITVSVTNAVGSSVWRVVILTD